MRIFLNFSAGCILVLMVCLGLCAQTTPKKPDVIHKIENTTLEVIIDEINKTDILYRKVTDPKGPLYALPKNEVRKIVWSNGDVEDITLPPAPVQKAANPITLLIKKDKAQVRFWDQKGPFGGLRLGAGVGMVATPFASVLTDDITLAYMGGVTLGYRIKALSVQVEALYTALTYPLILPEGIQGISSAEGQQQNLVVPLTATLATRLGKVRLGLTLGGFGAIQIGNGSTLITNSENTKTNFRNCAECTGEPTFGAVGGITATVLERPVYAIYLDARWYHSLADNKQYKIAENGINMHTGIVGLGVLFNLSGR